ncbi:MAG: sortase [Candidatus Peribacteraceae bacterium]|nr:sortase [Candidatus Peribacteraceae bacterium]
MFHRFLTGFCAVALLAQGVSPAYARTFSDTSSTVYADAFSYLSDQNIITGYADGTGRPNVPLNRAEALKVVMHLDPALQERVLHYQSRMPPIPLFWDIDQSAWYASSVEAAFEKGLLTGYPDGSLRPERLLSVEEAVTLLMRAVGEGQGTGSSAELSSYIENRSGEWFTAAVNAAIQKNLIMHRGRLRLGNAITRGQFFEMAYRLHVIRTRKLASFTGTEPAAPVAPSPVRTQGTVASTTVPYASEKYFSVSMPAIGINDLAITHPQDPFSKSGILAPLQYGVGHLFGYPGGGGKIMVYGHSSGYPWDLSQFTKIFRQINKLKVGDRVYITYSGTLHTYEVTYHETVDASDTTPFNDNGAGEELILYTCWPLDSISQRYLVHALPVGQVAVK